MQVFVLYKKRKIVRSWMLWGNYDSMIPAWMHKDRFEFDFKYDQSDLWL